MISGETNNKATRSSSCKPAYALSAVTAALLALQAVGGLFIKGLYRDNTWVTSIFRGTDLATLVLVVPLMLVALTATTRGSMRGRLILLGTLYFALYNNMYYLFSAFNRFFLVYVALFVLSAAALIAVLLGTEAQRMRSLDLGAPRRLVCLAMFACAAILAAMWIGQAAMYIANGKLPQLIIDSGGNTHVVAALDLTMIVPPLVLGGIWLWRARPWGVVIATSMLVQCTIITVDLVVTPPFQTTAGIKDAWTMVPLWASMGTAFLVSSVYMLRHIRVGS